MRSCQALGKQSNRCQFVVWLGLYIVKERVQCLRPFTQSLPSCRSSLSSLLQHLRWPYDLPLLTPSFSLALPCPALPDCAKTTKPSTSFSFHLFMVNTKALLLLTTSLVHALQKYFFLSSISSFFLLFS